MEAKAGRRKSVESLKIWPINVSCMCPGAQGKDPVAEVGFVSGLVEEVGNLVGNGRAMKIDRATRHWEDIGDGRWRGL